MLSGEPKATNSLEAVKNALFTWEFFFFQVLLVALVAILLETPTGSIAGNIALEQQKFGLYSYNLKENKVYALVTGPRGGPQVERGAWVNNDGTFKVQNLPVGEYLLEVRAPGFSREFVKGLYVEDGKVSKLPKEVKLSLLSPSVNIASNSRVFTTKNKPNFWVNATGASEVEVNVYKGDLMALSNVETQKKWGVTLSSDMSLYLDSSAKFNNPFTGQNAVQNFKRKLVQDSSDSSHAEFQFDQTLPPGDYFTVAKVRDLFGKEGAQALTWFSVSDIGLVIKQCPGQTVVRAVDLNTLKSAQGVNIDIAERLEGGIIKSRVKGTTDANGMANLPLPADLKYKSGMDVLCNGVKGDNKAYGGYNYWLSNSDLHKTYFYTERPVYRIGQTVLFKGVSRNVSEDGMTNPGAGQKLNITVEDPDNNELKTMTVTTNSHGTFNGLIEIPENGKTGGYQVQIAYPDGYTSYQSFEVAQYRKPEYQVEVEPLAERVIAGEKGRARVRATYYFGGPVANARIKYSIYSSTDYSARYKLEDRPDYYAYFDSWGCGEDDYENSSGDFIAEGYAVTDSNGEAVVEFDTTAPTRSASGPIGNEYVDKKLRVEAEVTDISRLSVVSSGSMPESTGNFMLMVSPQSWVVETGKSMPVEVRAVSYDGKPVANKSVSLKMLRFPYDSIKQTYKPDELLANQSVTTDKDGKATLVFNIGNQFVTDSYYVIGEAQDDAGHTVLDSTSIWVASDARPFFYSDREAKSVPLNVKLDKKVYKAGEVAKAIISGPFTGKEGMEALVGIEGSKLHDIKVVPLTSSAQLVEIPIKANLTPNFYVSVSIVGPKRQFYTHEEMVMVSPDFHFLKLAVTTDKEKYKPGEEANYTITALTSDGKPAKGVELSMGVVDESIYSIRAEAAQDIRTFFYSQISNWVSTHCSFPESYSGGPDKLEARVRKDFKDTAVWFPNLVTDAKGQAHAKFRLPDNLTTWRATVRGVSTGTDVGSTVQKVIATQDIIARLALPRFFAQGDEGIVTGIVHNYTSKPQTVKINLTMGSNLTTTVPLAQTLTIDPDGAKRFDWPVVAKTIGDTTIKLTAYGQTAADALERQISVKPMGIPVTIASAGVLKDAVADFNLDLPDVTDAAPGTLVRELSLAGSTIGPVLGNFNSLIDYPYGCTEQTMSRLVPSIVAMQLNKKLSVPLTGGDKIKFDRVYTEAMAKLASYQHGDGGWGWWQDDSSQPYLTSYVMEGMKLLQDTGYKVDTAAMQRASQYNVQTTAELVKQLSDPKRVADDYFDREVITDLSYLLYSQSLWSDKSQLTAADKAKALAARNAAVTYLKNNINTLTPVAVAYSARAAKNLGDETLANLMIERLIAIANTSDSTVDWELTSQLATKIGDPKRHYWGYRFTPEETTALALSALVEVKPEDTATTERVKTWLLMQRGKDAWGTTKATAAVFKALLAEELLNGQGSKDSKISCLVSSIGDVIKQTLPGQTYDLANRYGAESLLPLSNQDKGYQLKLTTEGTGRLYYNAQTRYFKNLAGKTGPTGIANIPSDLSVVRTFYRLQSVATTTDGTIHLKSVPITGPIKAGETILMKVVVDSPRTMPYVMVEAALPSGAEVVQDSPKEGAVEEETSTDSSIVGDWQRAWWTHQDILDDKIVFFGSNIKAGKSEFTTLLRMELPGKVGVAPINLEGMYSKNIKGLSSIDNLTITDK